MARMVSSSLNNHSHSATSILQDGDELYITSSSFQPLQKNSSMRADLHKSIEFDDIDDLLDDDNNNNNDDDDDDPSHSSTSNSSNPSRRANRKHLPDSTAPGTPYSKKGKDKSRLRNRWAWPWPWIIKRKSGAAATTKVDSTSTHCDNPVKTTLSSNLLDLNGQGSGNHTIRTETTAATTCRIDMLPTRRSDRFDITTSRSLLQRQSAQVCGRDSVARARWRRPSVIDDPAKAKLTDLCEEDEDAPSDELDQKLPPNIELPDWCKSSFEGVSQNNLMNNMYDPRSASAAMKRSGRNIRLQPLNSAYFHNCHEMEDSGPIDYDAPVHLVGSERSTETGKTISIHGESPQSAVLATGRVMFAQSVVFPSDLQSDCDSDSSGGSGCFLPIA